MNGCAAAISEALAHADPGHKQSVDAEGVGVASKNAAVGHGAGGLHDQASDRPLVVVQGYSGSS